MNDAARQRPSKIVVRNLNAWFGKTHALRGVSLDVPENSVLAIIGPSGCGKSTFVRCINRMHELVPGAKQTGHVLVDGQDLHGRGVDPVDLRLHLAAQREQLGAQVVQLHVVRLVGVLLERHVVPSRYVESGSAAESGGG